MFKAHLERRSRRWHEHRSIHLSAALCAKPSEGRAMRITLDISKLVEESKLAREEADKLNALAAYETGSLGINI
jgi:hypothetical protein